MGTYYFKCTHSWVSLWAGGFNTRKCNDSKVDNISTISSLRLMDVERAFCKKMV